MHFEQKRAPAKVEGNGVFRPWEEQCKDCLVCLERLYDSKKATCGGGGGESGGENCRR